MHIPTSDEIKARREVLGIRQAELAKRAGISQSMVARIEAGTVDPRVSTLTKIIEVLNTAERSKVTAAMVMHTPVFAVGSTEPIGVAIEMMDRNSISQLPVIDEGVPVGCISESAIVNALDDPVHYRKEESRIRDFMESGFPTVPPDMDIETVVRILQHNHAVLVMESGKVQGVITKHDLIPLIVER